MKKKATDPTFEQFKLLTNQLFFVDIKTIAECLGISAKTCLRYIERQNEDARQIRNEIYENELEDVNEPANAERLANGTCRTYDQYSSPYVSFTKEETEFLKKWLTDEKEEMKVIRQKLFRLFTHYTCRPELFKENMKVIDICIREKREMVAKAIFTDNKIFSKETEYSDPVFSPVHVDIEKSILYALMVEDRKPIKINIHAIKNCFQSNKGTIIDYRTCNTGENYFSDNKVDIFGSFYDKKNKSRLYTVQLNMDSYAYAEFLKESIHFKKFIKEDKANNLYPYKLKMDVFELKPIFNLILSVYNHIKIIGSKKFIRAVQEQMNEIKKAFDKFK